WPRCLCRRGAPERRRRRPMNSVPIKARQTVTRDGRSIAPVIAGVRIHPQVTQQDDRGTLTEIYSPFWEFDDIPLVYLYTVTVHPGKVKGWAVHSEKVDRCFFYWGSLRLVLYDNRADSPTCRMVNDLYFSETNRSLVLVPPGVYHAVQNVGTTEGLMF